MGRWTPQHYDILLADKIQLALRPALQNYEIKYETFVEALDGGDALVQNLIATLVLDMAQRRSTSSSLSISMRTAAAVRHITGYGTPYRRSFANNRNTRHQSLTTRSARRAELFVADDDFDGFSPAPQVPSPTLPSDALEAMPSQNLHDAYNPHPPTYTPELVMTSQDYWSAPGELQDVWDWQPSRSEPLPENTHHSLPPNTMEGSLYERESPPYYFRSTYGRQQVSSPASLNRQTMLRRMIPRPRHVADFSDAAPHPTSHPTRRSTIRSQYRTLSHPSRSWLPDREWAESVDSTDDIMNSTPSASTLHRLRHLEVPNNIPSVEDGLQVSAWPTSNAPPRRTDPPGNPGPSAAAPRNWRSGGRTHILPYSVRIHADGMYEDSQSSNDEATPTNSYPPRLPTPRSLSPNLPPSEGAVPSTPHS